MSIRKLQDPPFAHAARRWMVHIADQLVAKGWTMATAESCTSGLVANSMTMLSGSSAYFRGAVVAYAADRKQDVLGVPADLIAQHGVVSEEVAAAMAAGACRVMDATMAVATTGVLGPNPEEDGTPVGTLCLAIHHKDQPGLTRTVALTHDDRHANLNQATLASLQLIADYLG